MSKTAVIVGAGPAGLTAALELLRQTDVIPIVVEAGDEIGGLSRTVRHKGNRMDIGGHRFFSKSDRVMRWWLEIFPVEAACSPDGELRYRSRRSGLAAWKSARDPQTANLQITDLRAPDPQTEDRVMLVRKRRSRIYFLRRFFDYPLRVTAATLRNMGLMRTLRCGASYMRSALWPLGKETTLEDFLINRFGRQLYLTFFKSYTEKVWGVPCSQIGAEWGAQRIKGLSLKRAVADFLSKSFARKRRGAMEQKQTETSLIERFLYPKLGPGQLWEHVADLIRRRGGEIHLGVPIDRVHVEGNRFVSAEGANKAGERIVFAGDYFFSTMPVRELIRALAVPVPSEVVEVSEGLKYRDFIIVGLLVSKLSVTEKDGSPLKDNWIYIQEPDVLVGRVQIFNNWSPWLVDSPDKAWIGLEYFCYESDSIWKLPDEEMARFAIGEAQKIGILKAEDVEDFHVVRVPKTYPAYFGSYDRFHIICEYLDRYENFFLIGRNGMHKYNNQDHSMLTAITAVENIVNDVKTKDNIWSINTEMEYSEEHSPK